MKLPWLAVLCAAVLLSPVGMAGADPDKDALGKGRERYEYAADEDRPDKKYRKEWPKALEAERGAAFYEQGYQRLPIPPGHYPPPGECRFWYPDRPPGHQPPPGPCSPVPYGAWVIRHPQDDPGSAKAEMLYRGGRGIRGEPDTTKLAEVETRLRALEQQLTSRRSMTPPTGPPPATPAPSFPPPPASLLPLPAPPQQEALPPPPQVAAVPPGTSLPPPAVEGHGADQLYQRGLQEYRAGQYESAVAYLRQFLQQAPQAAQAGNAQYLLGEAHYAQKQYELAIVAFDDVVLKYPKYAHVAAAILKEGYAFAALKDVHNARYFLRWQYGLWLRRTPEQHHGSAQYRRGLPHDGQQHHRPQ